MEATGNRMNDGDNRDNREGQVNRPGNLNSPDSPSTSGVSGGSPLIYQNGFVSSHSLRTIKRAVLHGWIRLSNRTDLSDALARIILDDARDDKSRISAYRALVSADDVTIREMALALSIPDEPQPGTQEDAAQARPVDAAPIIALPANGRHSA